MDRDGNQVVSTYAPSNARRVNVADRAHFRFHLDPSRDELYISDPVTGRGSGEETIQFTRKLLDANGAFNGIVVLSLSCAELSAFYDTLEPGDGFVALTDGHRTIMARGPVRPRAIGTRLSGPPNGGESLRLVHDDHAMG